MPVTSTWPSPPNPSLQCTYHYRAKAVHTSVDWQVCLHTENVLWRRNVWDLGGISLKSKSTTNIFTTVLFGLNRVWSQIKQELISHRHSSQETEKTAALKCHVISLEVLFLSSRATEGHCNQNFPICCFDNFKTSKHLFCMHYSTKATWKPYKITFNISFTLLKI